VLSLSSNVFGTPQMVRPDRCLRQGSWCALLAERNGRVAVADPPDVPAFTPAWGGTVAGRVTMGNGPRSEREFASALDAFGPITELLTAKCGEDLVLRSGLAPAQFALRDGMIELSNCLLATRSLGMADRAGPQLRP
jgi:hypothetical protein